METLREFCENRITFDNLPIRLQIMISRYGRLQPSVSYKRFDEFCTSLILVPDQSSIFKHSLTSDLIGVPVSFNILLWICTFNSIFISSHYLMPLVYLDRDKNEFKCNYFPEILSEFNRLETSSRIGLVFPTLVYANRDMSGNHMITLVYEKIGDEFTLSVIDSSGMAQNYLKMLEGIFPHKSLNLNYNFHGQSGRNCTLNSYLWGMMCIFNRPLVYNFDYRNIYKSLIELVIEYEEETVGTEEIPKETFKIYNERWGKLIKTPTDEFVIKLKEQLEKII